MKIPTWFSLQIEIPFFRVRTDVMSYSFECRILLYYLLHISLFRWSFEFEIGRKDNA